MEITAIFSLSLVLLLSLPSPSLSATKCNSHDKAALLEIKAAMNNLGTWDPNTDCCSWYGIECDSKGRVISITIFDADISGQISPVIGNLSYLQMIDINTLTNLTGTIPSTITKLSRLNLLRLKSNRLSGPIPSFLSKLKRLYFLDLSFNFFSGSIPASLSQLPNLLALHLDHNNLTGTVPESFGHFAGITPDLFLSNNFLTGALPKSLGYVNFTEIDVSFNNFVGDASFLFGKNKTVNFVELNSNSLQFDLSNVVFPDGLKKLVIDHNKIFGTLPQGLTQLNLQALNVSYNNLSGQIPQGGKLQSFVSSAYDHNNGLCGAPLPACN